MKRFVVHLQPVVSADGSTASHYFSADAWCTLPTDTPPNTAVRGLLKNPGTLQRDLFERQRVTGPIQSSYGNIVLANPAPDADGPGVLDAWTEYGLAGAEVQVLWGEAGAAFPAGYSTVYRAFCHSFFVDSQEVTIRLRDAMQLLDQPVVTDGFAGTGGIEGNGSTDKRKQFVSSDPGLFTPILVDAIRQIYYVQSTSSGGLHDYALIEPTLEVRPFDSFDQAIRLTRVWPNYATSAELLAAAPGAGEAKWWFGPDSTSVSGWKNGPVYFRLGSPPAGDIRVYALGYPTDADASRLGAVRGTFNASHFALRAGVPLADISASAGSLAVAAVLVDDSATYADVLADQALGLQGWFGFSRLGIFRSGYLCDPESDSIYYGITPGLATIPSAATTSAHTFVERGIEDLRREPVAGMEVPVWSVAATVGNTWPSQIANGASDTLRDYLTRKVWASISGVAGGTKLWDPGAIYADVAIKARLLQNSFSIRLWLERYFVLYGGKRSFFSFHAPMSEELLALDLHDVVTLQHRRFSLQDGKKFRIVSIRIDCSSSVPTMRFLVWGGTTGRYTGGSSSIDGGDGGGSNPPFVSPLPAFASLGDFTGAGYGYPSITGDGPGGAGGATADSIGDFTGSGYGYASDPPISGESYVISGVVDVAVAVPAHSAGDLLVVVARSGASASPPSTPSGWTSVAAPTVTFGNGYRVAWIVDTGNSITSFDVSTIGASFAAIHIYSGASAVGAVATQAEDVGTTATFPALTMDDTSGASWVMTVASLNQGVTMTDPSGLTARLNADGLGGGELQTWDSNGGVGSWSSQTSTWSGSSYWTTVALEIKV